MTPPRSKAGEQSTLSFAGLGLRFAGGPPRRCGWRDGVDRWRAMGPLALIVLSSICLTRLPGQVGWNKGIRAAIAAWVSYYR